ncbi:MAG: NYN domain-containing protein [Pseudomonas sp.]
MNPFEQGRTQLHAELRTTSDRLKARRTTLADARAFNLDAKLGEIETHRRELEDGKTELDRLSLAMTMLQEDAARVELLRAPRWNLRAWFSVDQRLLRRGIEYQQQKIFELRQSRALKDSRLSDIEKRVSQLHDEVASYKALDLTALRVEVDRLSSIKESLTSQVEEIDRKWNRVESAIAPERENLNAIEVEIAQNHRQRAEITEILRLFDGADGRERALLHRRCEKTFDESSPRAIDGRLARKRSQLARDKASKESALREALRRSTMDIQSLVIDGNNLCYEKTSSPRKSFVGIEPLKAIVGAVAGSYDVTVVFDSGIRGLMGMRDHELAAAIGHDVTVHVMPGKEAADETIIKLAEPAGSYVLTNDRYRNALGNPAVVRENRLLEHSIVGSRVLVNELDINIDLGTAPKAKTRQRRPPRLPPAA